MDQPEHGGQAGDTTLPLEAAGRSPDWRAWGGAVPAFELVLQAPSDASVLGRHLTVRPGQPAAEAGTRGVTLRYPDVPAGDQRLPVELTVTVAAENDRLSFQIEVANHTRDWVVREVRGPIVAAPLAGALALLWPQGAGERVADPARLGLREAPYPAQLFMPWMVLDAGDGGHYYGVHGDELASIMLRADAHAEPGRLRLSASQYPFCRPGETWRGATVVLRAYRGTWHEAARTYRAHAETWWQPVEPPAWLREATGWQLVILKQQNGEIHWPYRDLDRLCELGRENGLNVLGLFGWTEGGHDRRYPIYQPDPAMGGEAALRAAIERAHRAGQRVVLYTNGQLRDLQTEWHAEHGPATAAVSERGEAFGESWQKYRDAPARPMSYACQSSSAWSDVLAGLARRAHELGADGILFDQLGSAQPMFCFSAGHGHDHPARATGPGVAAMLRRVQQEMAALDPDFIVMIEHVTDALNQQVDLTHGCHIGFDPRAASFPELLRFTFPELLATQRHPTPVMDRRAANWACLYGFLHEVEYRYAPDREYVDRGVVPSPADYARIASPPDVGLMRRLDPREANAYLRRVGEFAGRHRDLLRDGRFEDTLGFELANPRLVAKAYRASAGFGVMVWNPTAGAEPVALTAAGWTLDSTDAPEPAAADPAAPLPPESLRLYRFSRALA